MVVLVLNSRTTVSGRCRQLEAIEVMIELSIPTAIKPCSGKFN